MTPESQTPLPVASPPPPGPPGQKPPASVSAHPGAHEQLLALVRQRQRRELRRQGILYGLGVAAVLLLLSGFAAWLWAPLGKFLFWSAPLGGAAVAAAFSWIRARREVGDDLRTARLIGRRVPALSQGVLSAVELKAERQREGVSQELIDAFLAHIDSRVVEVESRTVVDARGSRRAGLWVTALGLLCFLVLLLAYPTWLGGLKKSFATQPSSAAATLREPITGDMELTYQYPAYTGLAPKTVKESSGEISGPSGTRVNFKTRADREVVRAEAVVNGVALPLTIEGGRNLSGTLVLEKSGQYFFRFLSAQGLLLAEGPPVPLSVETDQPPKVSIIAPGEELEVDPAQRVTVKFDVSDDYGLSDLALVFKISGQSGEQRLTLPHDEGRTYRASYTWDLAPLKLRPGDRVSYFLEARDNDEPAGKKRGTSRAQLLKTYSPSEHRLQAQQKVEALWERLLSHLANRMEGPDRNKQRTLDQLRGQIPVDEQGMTLTQEMNETAAQLSRDKDAPKELWTALVTISGTLRPKVSTTSGSRAFVLRYADQPVGDFDPGKRLTRAVDQEIAEAQRDVFYLEALLDRRKLQELKALAQELAQDRRDLTKLVEEYKRAGDPAVKEEVQKRITQMRERIQQLLQRMSDLASKIRDEHFNQEAVKKLLEEKDLSADLDQVEKLLKEGKVDEALKQLQKMSLQMEDMIRQMDDSEGKVGEMDPKLAQQFQQFTEQLQQTEQAQAALAKNTQEIRERYRQQLKQRLSQHGQAMRQKLSEDAARVAKDYAGFDPHALQSSAERPLEAAQSELQTLQDALKASDFDLASEAAQRSEEMGRELAALGEQQQMMDEVFHNPPEVRAQTKKTAERLKGDHRTLQEISQKLQQLFPNPASLMSEADKSKLKELSEAQRKLKQQAKSLQDQMREISQQVPVFDPGAEAQMNQVGEKMGQAADKLEARDPARGHGDQKAALEQLQKFQQALKEGGSQGGKKGGVPLPMMAGGNAGFGAANPHEKVELPDENQFQGPAELRKDLLDAMKQGAPDRYREQVKRYYEELVK